MGTSTPRRASARSTTVSGQKSGRLGTRGARSPIQRVLVDNTDKGEVAELLVQIEAVTENKLVLDIEPYIVRNDSDFAARSFVQEGAQLEAGGVTGLQHFDHEVEGVTTIDDVFDDQYIAVFDVR